MKIFNVAAAAATIAVMILYILNGQLLIKGAASLCFAIMACVNMIYALRCGGSDRQFAVFVAVGHVISMGADVVLNLTFIPGAAMFAAAHVCYIIGYCFHMRFGMRDVLCTLPFIAFAIIFIKLPIFDFGGMSMEILCIIYGVIISLMVGKAFSNLTRERCMTNSVLVCGSILFYFSDMMLVADVFSGGSDIADTLCVSTYYAGQCLIACSIFLATERAKEKKEQV